MPVDSGLVSATKRCSSSIDRKSTEPMTTSPNLHGNGKMKKHAAHPGRTHTRDPSIKSIHKLHGDSHADSGSRKQVRNTSTANLKKNNSNTSLKRNRSSSEFKPKFTVAFEIGEQEDGWEETSSSASPAVSREHSRTSSETKNIKKKSPVHPGSQAANKSLRQNTVNKQSTNASGANSKTINERLISHPQSRHTTHMSLATATTSTVISNSSPSSPTSAARLNSELTSHFVAASGTPSESSHFLFHSHVSSRTSDDVKRAQSMKNLTNRQSDGETSALRPCQLGAGQSRTQQKLWLQRASSILEPEQVTANYGNEVGFLMGTTHEGRNPRIKNLLSRTGIQYLVVRRYQDPIGDAMKRINQIPAMERTRRISLVSRKSMDGSSNGSPSARISSCINLKGYNQIKNTASTNIVPRISKNARSSSHDIKSNTYGHTNDNATENEMRNSRFSYDENENENITVLLRKLWDKSPDLTASAD